MKITISKSQWERIGKTAGWADWSKEDMDSFRNERTKSPSGGLVRDHLGMNNDVDESTGITKEQMAKYIRHQRGGKYNMLMNGDIVAKLMGITKEQYLSILNNYDRLLEKWKDLEETI